MKNQTTVLEEAQFDPFSGPEIVRVIHTTQAQEEIWAACSIGGENANKAYNESVSLVLRGKLQVDAIVFALQGVVDRHGSLRAVFSTNGRYMMVLEHISVELDYHDISSQGTSEKVKSIQNYLTSDSNHLFNLIEGPLIKVGLVKISDKEHRFIFTAHHIICDGWSLGIILQELGVFYSAKVLGEAPVLPKPESFGEFADEQHVLIGSKEYDSIEKFWLAQYQNTIPELTLPTDFQRPSLRTYKSNRLDFQIDSVLLSKLKNTGVKAGSSFVTTLMAAFEIFLYRQTGQEDLVLGLPSAGQSIAGMTQLIGHCVNLLPLRSKISTDISFADYLRQRKSNLFDVYDHQPLSFGHLLQKLAIGRAPSRVPLVPVVFNIDLGMTDSVSFYGLDYELLSNPRAYEVFELFLNASGSEENLVLEWSYNVALFKPETIKHMMRGFEEVLSQLIAKPNQKIGDFIALDRRAYDKLNVTKAAYPSLPLHKLIAERALKNPEKSALKFKGKAISYKDLEERTNRLANYFISVGMMPGDFVGICAPRSPEMLIFLLAVMKCGGAYIPMDPTYPLERLKFMLEDSEAKFLVITAELSTSIPDGPIKIVIEDAIEVRASHPIKQPVTNVNQSDLAYLIYTSGSTGKPKGVPVTHKNLVNFLCSMTSEPGIGENDKLLAVTTISFDIAGLELFLPLLNGATLVLVEDITVRDGRILLEVLQNESISMLQATPTTWQMLIDVGWEKPLGLKALCGGEAFPFKLAQQLLERCDEVWNMYGPTETTIWSTIKQINSDDSSITIGRPIANTQVYILNEKKRLVASNNVGEICIAGDGVAQGYWKRKGLTSEKFIENTFGSENDKVLYRTGDLGKLLPNGEVLCLGRIDQQVKIRGHRIEPGEIEQALISLDGVRAAIVMAHSDFLVAHIVPSTKVVSIDNQAKFWRDSLVAFLPNHLIPNKFNLIDSIPTTPNGKIDRKSLIETESNRFEVVQEVKPEYTLARTGREKLVAEAWKECLGLEEVDIFSDFFELGGHSLVAVRVMALLEQKTGKRLPLSSLFEHSTIEKLAKLLDDDGKSISWGPLVPIKPNGIKVPLYVIHGAGLNLLKFHDLIKNLDDEQAVFGLQGIGLSGSDKPLRTVEEMASFYIEAILRSNPEGPLALAGYSLGGIIAYEMARQLLEQGKDLKMVGMLDTYIEPYYFYSSRLGQRIAKANFYKNWAIYDFKMMIRNRDYFKTRLKGKIKRVKAKLFKSHVKETENPMESAQLNSELKEIVNTALTSYRFTPLKFEVDLFKASEQTYYMHEPEKLGWSEIAIEGVNVHHVPGDHSSIFSLPNVKETAKVLQGVLNERNIKL